MTARLEVHKFGGTSVADADRMRGVAGLVAAARARARVVVVTSATAGTTDALLHLAHRAAAGDRGGAGPAVEALMARHLALADALATPPAVQQQVLSRLEELQALVAALGVTGELSLRVRDHLLVTGEKLAATLLAHALDAAGCPAEAAYADTFLDTDDRFGEARPLGGVFERTTQAALHPLLAAGRVPVVTGFTGRAPDGSTTTLGRGGSDLSATLIAAALGADEVTIWTDVDGVFSADPRVVPGARVIQHLNYREAAEMSFYGAKVLHQRTMIPAQSARIPVITRNSLRPEAAGTVVDARFTPGSHPVKAVSAVRAQALLSVEGKGMAGVPGVSARVFGALAARGISVTMISQASSESSICLALPAAQAEEAALALREAFRPELSRGEVEEVGLKPGVGLVAVVGLGMARTRGVAARATGACADAGVNILAIAQGSSELNLTFALEEADLDRGVRALHEGFGLHRADTGVDDPGGLNLVLLGLGAIGQDLLRLLEARGAHVRARFGLTPRVVAVVDRTGYLLDPAGLSAERLRAAAAGKRAGRALAQQGGVAGDAQDALRAALEYRLTRPILVDVSDADGAEALFEEALGRGCDVVTANKKPLAGARGAFDALWAAAARAGRVLKAEATVGAGLPVIDTLEILLGTGDQVRAVEGCLSGTLGFVMSALEAGRPLSAAVAEAKALGYTEPDPVADLSGADVARKALILARWSGLAGPEDEPAVALEGLVDAGWAGLPWPELSARLVTLDESFAARRAEAAAAGEVWRYVARVAPGVIQVGPARVAKDSPAGRLAGTENLVVFHSDRYATIPLVVTGPGAGVEVTAMGVLGDILRVAAERRRP